MGQTGKKQLTADTEQQATSGEVTDLKREMRTLKEVVAELHASLHSFRNR